MSGELLRAVGLSCERAERVLFEAVSFTVRSGQMQLVTGPNGAGKTTLLRCLAGVYQQYRGDLYWRERPVSASRYDFCKGSLYLGHETGVKLALTPRENLHWDCALWGQPAVGIDQALTGIGLARHLDTLCGNLSAGQRRRVALARLLLSDADLWILDEPFTAIDVAGVRLLEARIESHLQRGGAVILTTHQPLSGRFDAAQLTLGDGVSG